MPGTVVYLGAGATKACDGPLTSEILPNILRTVPTPGSTDRIDLLQTFLSEQFNVSSASPNEQFPALPLVMSLIDTALDRRESLHPQWDPARLSQLREGIELGIFDHLEEKLYKAQTNNHWELLQRLYPQPAEPCVISSNYDLIVDTAMMFLSEARSSEGRLPDYRCHIRTDFYNIEPARFGTLLKLHGSLNWLYCKTCHRLEIGASESRKYLKVLSRLVGPSLEQSYTPDGSPCPTCQTKLRPLLVAPSHLKDYRNPHLGQVWYEAERVLRDADRVIFIGYSLPDDDVEIVYLLKRSLARAAGTPPVAITVVEYDPALPHQRLQDHPIGRRYRTLFGDNLDWHPEGLNDWVNAQPTP
jgi:hypothetical protein